MSQFANKNVIVTGAGIGIGYAICQAFAQEGAIVGLNDIDEEVARQAARQINEQVVGERVIPYGLDVANVEALQTMVDDFSTRHGGLDIMVANAGITNYGAFLDYSPDAFDLLMNVNLRGSYFTAQAAAKQMIVNKIAGRIVLMSSVTGTQAFQNLSAYGITKAGIRMMARVLGLELGRYGITVNAISPGATLTERTLLDDPNYEENWAGVTPTGRVGYVEDIVAAVLFLASPAARQVNGHTLQVDGGWTVHSPIPEDHPEEPEFSSQLR